MIVATLTLDLSLELYLEIAAVKLISLELLSSAISLIIVPAAIISMDEVGRQ
jgi:hypothetical protein